MHRLRRLLMTKCPQKKIPNKFDQNIGMRTATSTSLSPGRTNTPVIDRDNCTKFKTGKCGAPSEGLWLAPSIEQQDQL
jgi:heterodisulfide reductase subunit A